MNRQRTKLVRAIEEAIAYLRGTADAKAAEVANNLQTELQVADANHVVLGYWHQLLFRHNIARLFEKYSHSREMRVVLTEIKDACKPMGQDLMRLWLNKPLSRSRELVILLITELIEHSDYLTARKDRLHGGTRKLAHRAGNELARMLGRAIGKELKYNEVLPAKEKSKR